MMKADKKIIFLDIDGTLTANLGKPSEKVKEGIRKARENGHKVLICTGRNMPIIGREILDCGFDGVVASAGSHIEVEGNVIFDCLMDESLVQYCIDIFHKNHIFCRIESPEGIYTDTAMEELLKNAQADSSNSELIRMQREMESGLDIKRFDAYPRNGAYKLCFTCTDLRDLEAVKAQLGEQFNYVVHPFQAGASVFNGEIIRKGMDKGEGMQRVCQYYGMSMRDTVAFGDSMNDFQMIQAAGLGVAMGNACDELKEIADVVCESVQEDGVYQQFSRMGLIVQAD